MIIWRKILTHRAFTLVEALLVLAVVSCFSLLPVLAVKGWQEELEVAHFFSRFEKMLLVSQQIAIIEGVGTKVHVERSTNLVKFQTEGTNAKTGTLHEEDRFPPLEIPNPLKYSGGNTTEFSFIQDAGSPRKLTSVTFSRNDKSMKVKYQLQMGSGRFEKTVE